MFGGDAVERLIEVGPGIVDGHDHRDERVRVVRVRIVGIVGVVLGFVAR